MTRRRPSALLPLVRLLACPRQNPRGRRPPAHSLGHPLPTGSEWPRGDRSPARGLAGYLRGISPGSGPRLRASADARTSPATPATGVSGLGVSVRCACCLPRRTLRAGRRCCSFSPATCERGPDPLEAARVGTWALCTRGAVCGAGTALLARTTAMRVRPPCPRLAPRGPSDAPPTRLVRGHSGPPGPPSCAEQALWGAGRRTSRFCPGPDTGRV